ncbi:MAG: trehalose-phosphatase [Deltaproteobacteria bacterium]|nr:trehalose-phosphatase [Deltaproteobacteria bacterium]
MLRLPHLPAHHQDPAPGRAGPAFSSPAAVRALLETARAAPSLLLLLDYDGTLVPIAPTPDQAVPDAALLALLRRLAARPATAVHVVSGRKHDFLEQHLGALPVGLHAEHGVWSRPAGGSWRSVPLDDLSWMVPARALLVGFLARTPGALLEEKTAGYSWHYRAADPELGRLHARELSLGLATLLRGAPAQVMQGDRVVEVRPSEVHKGTVPRALAAGAPPGVLLLALGDDRTDEDLFAGLPDGGLAVHVGPSDSLAPLRVADVAAARRLLEELAAG